MAELDPAVLAAVANSNFKTVAEMGTLNALAHQNRINVLAEASLGQILNRMNSLDPEEAAAIAGVVSSDLAEKLGELAGAIASSQQLMKGANTTQPETGR